MNDQEKVINGLAHCKCRSGCNSNCPYSPIMEDHNFGIDECTSQMADDALSLLEAQQKRIKELEELLYKGGCDGLNACSVKSCPYYNASHVRMEETKDAIILELQAENEKLKAQINDLQTAKTPAVCGRQLGWQEQGHNLPSAKKCRAISMFKAQARANRGGDGCKRSQEL